MLKSLANARLLKNHGLVRCNSAVIIVDSTASKIEVQNPVVEIDGDEMTRVIWSMIKDEVL